MTRYLQLIALCALASAHAQEAVNYGSAGGRVLDPSGAVVPAATVSARELATNITSTTATDNEGRFRFPYLKIGDYEIAVAHEGFADTTRKLTISAGTAFELPIQLAVAGAGTNVIVEGEAAVLDTARTQVAATMPRSEIASLPLNGRSFLDATLALPGVSPTNTASNQLFAETSAVPGQGISIGSQRNFSNSFIVDGLSANDDAAGLAGVFYSLDTIQELQVVTSGGQAELGRALGGYINIVTRSGANSTHGDLYGYARNQRFNAANPLSHTTLPSTQAQYGASLGGPVLRDRTFYFANLEQRSLNQSGLITISPENVAAINTRLDAAGYPGSRLSTGLYPNPVHSSNELAKLDHRLSARDQFTIRYSRYAVSSDNSRGAGALNATTASAELDSSDHTLAVSNIATLSPRMVNETRGQIAFSNLNAPPSDPTGPAVGIAGIASFGTLSSSPTGRDNRMYEIVDNLSYQSGAHAFRAGADFLYNDLTINFPRSIRGSYSFSSLANFLQGTYNNSGFTQTFGNTVTAQTSPNAGFYAQDEWKLGSRFTLNLGLRYDLQLLQSIATDTNNIAPRAGFAWSPFASRRTVVRGSFGLYYDRVPLRALANALLSSGNTTALTSTTQVGVSLSPNQAGAPQFPNTISTLPPGVIPNFTTMSRNMQAAYSEQGSLEIEHQLAAHSTLSIGYQHLRGLHLIASINQNAPTCIAAGSNNGCRPNPAYGNHSQYSPAGDSHYDAAYASFVQRPVKWGSYRVSYTYSKALDNVGEFFFSAPLDNRNIWLDYGRSDDDQRHRLVFDGALHPGFGLELSGMLQYYSALPFNITTGSNTIQGTAARPTVNGAYISRNAGIGADFFNVSTRVSRTFTVHERVRLQAIAEAFNALNHRNDLTRNGTFGAGAYPSNPSPTFGQITAVNDLRVMQIALRLSF